MGISRFYVALIVSLVLVAAACGGSDDGGDADNDDGTASATTTTTAAATTQGDSGGTSTTPPPQDDGGSAPQDVPAVGEEGSFTVNDTEFVVTFLNRCIPFGGEDGETIDLQPVAQGQGGILFLYGTADSVEVTVQGNTLEELYGSIAFVADPFDTGEVHESTIAGDRWTGSATLNDIYDAADPVSVSWDVMIPSDVQDCSL